MRDINKLRDYLLENYVNEWGNLDLMGLDFSEFNGDVYIDDMKVQGDLHQSNQKVGGDLHQYRHVVQGNLYQSGNEVKGNLSQSGQRVQGYLYQSASTVQGNLINENHIYGGELHENESTKMLKEVSAKELAEMGYELRREDIIGYLR